MRNTFIRLIPLPMAEPLLIHELRNGYFDRLYQLFIRFIFLIFFLIFHEFFKIFKFNN